MGFFSKLFGASSPRERDLEKMYVGMFVSEKGMSPSDARRAVHQLMQQAKEEAQKEGTTNLPADFGDSLLEREATDGKIKSMLATKRREGVTDDDIRWWWNMPDLERRMMIKDDDATRLALFIHNRQQGSNPEQAADVVKKFHPIYGDPSDTSKSQGDDRPLPYELKDRINIYVQKRFQQEAEAFKEELERSSSFNALVRREIRNGNI